MDPVTHGLIGASTASLFAKKKQLRSAAWVGLVGTMLPDLDVFIDSASDPLLQLEYHRQFSHSLVFIPVGALLVTLIAWWFVRKKLSFVQTYLYSILGMSTAGLVDVMTSYGVQWFWPFTEERIAWNVISVFDPLCSLVVLILLGTAVYRNERLFAKLAIGWAAAFFLFGWIQQNRAQTLAFSVANSRGHQLEYLTVKPTIANQWLWSIRYVHDDTLYADAVRLIPFSEPQFYPGSTAALLDWQSKYAPYKGSTLFNDIQRFSQLSDGILVSHPDYPDIIGDGRYAMLPTSVEPLWGIELNQAYPERHVSFNTYRDATSKVRRDFLQMLQGGEVEHE